MTLILRPRGRGNWTPLVVTIEGKVFPLLFRKGQNFAIVGINYRIVEVRA